MPATPDLPEYVEVAINLSQISDSYHYHLPRELVKEVQPGSLVIVPFGRQRVQGVILRHIATPEVPETRPVEALVDEKPVLNAVQLELAHWLAEETLSPLGACIDLMLPPGLSQHSDTLIQLNTQREIDETSLSPLEKRLVHLLQERGDLRGRQIDAHIRQVAWRGALRSLSDAGIVHTRSILPPPRVSPKTVRTVTLAVPREDLQALETPLSRVGRVHERRMKILSMLAEEPLPVEPSWIYAETGGNNGDLKSLEEAGLITFEQSQVWRDPLSDYSYVPTQGPELTRDQQAAWEILKEGLASARKSRAPKPFLLHGVTGSGKTELYLRALEETLTAGRQAIILVPEISLTPQTVRRFMARFPGQVGVVHSQLSEGERYDTWRRARLGELPVIIGPRSALFMPLKNLGLVVVDECHHESYDQQDSQPYYHAAETAVTCARLAGAVAILGSATPRVTQFHQTTTGEWTYLPLPRRILAHRETIARHARRLGLELPLKGGEGETSDLGLPEVTIVDMRQELHQGNRSIFSREMQSAIQHVLDTDQQAILFLNRRGSATYVFCRDCGFVIKCPRDDKPLTYHRAQNGLLCHTCGYQRQVPHTCPACGGRQIRQLGTGTEKVEAHVRERFTEARTLRWDAETTRKKGAHELILSNFSAHNADILIGTQMLAKGLDLPLVTLVGVILAEVGLNLPDFRATERTFQVLTQVAGRAGRSPLGGRVILQTYEPDNYAIQTAAHHDYDAFYNQEMDYRRLLRYPPFTRLVRLEYRHPDPRKAENEAHALADELRKWIQEDSSRTDMIGPAPCFFSRSYGKYRWQIVLRGPDPAKLLRGRQPADWQVEVDPPSLL
jgi:primosomal protein N' (replication factor Y)